MNGAAGPSSPAISAPSRLRSSRAACSGSLACPVRRSMSCSAKARSNSLRSAIGFEKGLSPVSPTSREGWGASYCVVAGPASGAGGRVGERKWPRKAGGIRKVAAKLPGLSVSGKSPCWICRVRLATRSSAPIDTTYSTFQRRLSSPRPFSAELWVRIVAVCAKTRPVSPWARRKSHKNRAAGATTRKVSRNATLALTFARNLPNPCRHFRAFAYTLPHFHRHCARLTCPPQHFQALTGILGSSFSEYQGQIRTSTSF